MYAEVHAGIASYSNYHTDDSRALLGVTVGHRFGSPSPARGERAHVDGAP